MVIVPQEWMRRYFEKNRESFKRFDSRETLDWSRGILYGEACLGGLGDVVVCFAAGEDELAYRWLDDVRWIIDESRRRIDRDDEIDFSGVDRAYVILADKIEKVLRDLGLDRTSRIPLQAFRRYLSLPTDLNPEDFDCVWLMWGLAAVLENRRDEYEELLATVNLKPHRELKRERDLLTKLGVLFDGRADSEFWDLYRSVLQHWLDPVLQTDSEAYLYRDGIRYLMALNWMVLKLHCERRSDFLAVLYGNL